MPERDDFDRIVEGLDLDFTFPDEPADPVVETPTRESVDEQDTADEAFYRHVEPAPVIPRRRGIILAWAGVAGAPLALVLATLGGIILDRPVVAGAALVFVASAIYLFLQLPEHGPSRRDFPDDGAVL